MRALITGDKGFVGPYLRDHLETLGIDVVGFDVKVSSLQDIRDYESVRLAIEQADPDFVYHLAAQAYVPESTSDIDRGVNVNIIGTLNLLQAMRHTGCHARVLVAGTSEEYGYHTNDEVSESVICEPNTPYGVTKMAAGHLARVYGRLYGIPVVRTRAVNHTGAGHTANYAVPGFAKKVALVEAGIERELWHGNLDAYRSYLDVRDVVEAYERLIHQEPGVYNIVSDRRLTMGSILEYLCQRTSKEIPRRQDPALYRRGEDAYPLFVTKYQDWQPEGWPRYSIEDTLDGLLDHWRGLV